MERGEKTNFIIRQFKRKAKKIVYKDYFTEIFYLNKSRSVIEFLKDETGNYVVEVFFKEFIPNEFKEFISLKILNDSEEEIKNWYYDDENLIILISINWGFKKEEITLELDISNFIITKIDNFGIVKREINYKLLNDHIISFLTLTARELSEKFEHLTHKKRKDLNNIKFEKTN
jgi:hypothetical protein